MTFQTMCALRIYLRRGDNAAPANFWQRMFRRPLATHILQQSLRAGITHASLSLGTMGFARGAKAVADDLQELPLSTLPVCLELVSPKPLLEQFVRDNAKLFAGATLVMLEGVHILPQVVEGDLPPSAHHVEYLTANGLTVPIDHVQLEDDAAPSNAKPPTA